MVRKKIFWIWVVTLALTFAVGCAIPVREAVKVDMKAPVGKIEGNQFTGIRYPFRVAAPPGWQISTQYPKFMIDLGYEKEGLEESEVFIFNPETRSNLQIDFVAADRYSTFDQQKIEGLVNSVTGEMQEELKQDFGKDLKTAVGATERTALKGVPYAAQKYVTYTAKGVKRQQGWVYAFAEPYQIFILYQVLEKEGKDDLAGIKAILESFEYAPK